MMTAAFRLVIDHHRQLTISGHMGQTVEHGVGAVSGNRLLAESRDILAATGKHLVFHPRNLAWIIWAKRMLSAIFEWTVGDGLISSRFNRTAAMSDAAMSRTGSGFLSSFLSGRPRPWQLLLGPGGPLKTSAGVYRNATQQHEQVTMTAS